MPDPLLRVSSASAGYRGVKVVRTAEISVDVIGVIVSGGDIRNLPIPRSVVLDLPKPDET